MNALWNELTTKLMTPALIAEKDPYGIKFAETPEEVLATQRLRYRVFNQEQGKGLESAENDGIDQDEYDRHSIHLMVYRKDTGEPVGTYRIIPGQQSVAGLYSSREFQIRGLDPLLSMTLEVGRSCVDPAYRDGSVVALLWMGIAEIMRRSGMRYLMGCVSLEETRSAAGWALYEYFKVHDLLDRAVTAEPVKGYELQKATPSAVESLFRDTARMRELMPPLLKGYFRLGARICGPPAFDYEFGTVDYLLLLDVARLPERYSRHFNVKVEA